VFGVVITAVYLLRALANVFFRARNERWDKVKDARGAFQRAPFVLLIFVLLLFGMYPKPITDVIDAGVRPVIAKAQIEVQKRHAKETGDGVGENGDEPAKEER